MLYTYFEFAPPCLHYPDWDKTQSSRSFTHFVAYSHLLNRDLHVHENREKNSSLGIQTLLQYRLSSEQSCIGDFGVILNLVIQDLRPKLT